MMDIREAVRVKAQAAHDVAGALAVVPTEVKNCALLAMAEALVAQKSQILEANTKDMLNAQSVLAVVLETEKRQEYPGRQAGAVIFRVLIPPLKIKTGQQKTE